MGTKYTKCLSYSSLLWPQRDFKAHDISGADYSKVKIPQASMGVPVDATFEGKTMNSEMFQNWGIQPRIR